MEQVEERIITEICNAEIHPSIEGKKEFNFPGSLEELKNKIIAQLKKEGYFLEEEQVGAVLKFKKNLSKEAGGDDCSENSLTIKFEGKFENKNVFSILEFCTGF